jgi:hypothetical protein
LDYYKEHGDFYDFRNCGRKTNHELIEVCLLLDPSVKVSISPSILEKYGNLHIRHLMSLLKSRECKALIRRGILTIRDFVEDPDTDHQHVKNFIKENRKRVWSLLRDIKYEAIVLNEECPVKEAFSIFMKLLNPLQKDIVKHRLLAPKENRRTLIILGYKHKITRERVRQLERVIIRDLMMFFRGDILNGRYLAKSSVIAILQHFFDLKIEVNPKLFKMWAENNGLVSPA